MRVSTREQALLGMSLEAQIQQCLQYARSHGLVLGSDSNIDVPGVFADTGESAYLKTSLYERKAARRMMACIQPGDQVISTAPHRLFRNVLAAETQLVHWDRYKVSVHFTGLNLRTDTPNGRLLLHILSAAAQWDSAIRSARQKEAWAWKKKKREVLEECEEAVVVDHKVENPREAKMRGLADVCIRMRQMQEVKQKKITGVIRVYLRVSTRSQTVGPQREAIERWLLADPEMREADIKWYIDHGYSAFKKQFSKRPAAQALMKELKEGDLVVALRADRVARTIIDMGRIISDIHRVGSYLCLIDCGLRTDDSQGVLMASIMGFVAQLESENVSLSKRAAATAAMMTDGIPEHEVPNELKSFEETKEPIRHTTTRKKTTCLRFLLTDNIVGDAMREFLRLIESKECEFTHFLTLGHDTLPVFRGFRTAAYRTELFIQERTGLPAFKRRSRSICGEGFREKYRTVSEAIQMLKESTVPGWEEARQEAIDHLSQFDPDAKYAGLIGSGWSQRSDYPKKVYNRLKNWSGACIRLYQEAGPLCPEIQGDLKTLLRIAGI